MYVGNVCRQCMYVMYVGTISGETLSGEIIRRAKLFVGRNFRHLAENSSLSPDKVSPDKVMYAGNVCR